MEEGEDVILFIKGVLWERKRQKKFVSQGLGEKDEI